MSDLKSSRRKPLLKSLRSTKKFMPTKHFANHTGAGILDDNPHATIDELLELKCPCYARFDTIFGTRANVAPLSQFDSLRPTL
ncbi:hypothetical protein KEM48_003324 [Puccinia striiformis f. sp. tritici PST-130]|nr:hypothetical protein KEM48_003324 [Puccinia striiformis f. sp. tritici PST-130]